MENWCKSGFECIFGGFGFQSGVLGGIDYGPEYADGIFLLIVAVLIVAGSVLALIGGLA